MNPEKNDYMTKRGSMKVFYDMAYHLMSTPKTMKDVFEIHTRFAVRDKNVFVFMEEDGGKVKAIKYKDYYDHVLSHSKAVNEALKDIEKDSFVAFKLKNSIHWPMFFWGLVSAGYKPLLIHPILNKEETEKLIAEAGAKAILCEDDFEYSVPAFNIRKIEVTDHKDYEPHWANEMAFCTSGTTGDSRIFVYDGPALSYQLYAAYCMPLTSCDIMYVGDIRLLAVIPFSHIFGFVAIFLWYTYFGMTIIFPKSNNPKDLVDTCIKFKCSHIYAVPLFWDTVARKFNNAIAHESAKKQKLVHKLIDYNNGFITKYEAGIAKSNFVKKAVQRKVLGDRIVYCISGGSVLSKDTLLTMNGIGYDLYNGYGMTEIGVTSVELSPDVRQRNKRSVGRPLTNVEYKLDGNELLVRSPFIHVARLKDGKRLPRDVDKDGYYHTGDIAEIGDDGYAYIRGKIKDVVIGPNGENIYPDEIETKFKALPYVESMTVLGLKNAKDEELLSLVINVEKELCDEETKQLENAIKEVNQTIPLAMQVKQCLIYKKPIPMNASMKIKKFEIEDAYKKNPEDFIKLEGGIVVSFEGFDKELVNKVVDHIINIIADVLYISKKDIAPNSNINIDLGGDSFSYMSIVSSIESEFEIQIPSEMIGKLNSASEFALYVLNHKD